MRKHVQKLDREIAKGTGIALPQVRLAIKKQQSTNAIFSCSVINFDGGMAIKGILCRLSGYFPTASAGRKSAVQATVA